MAGGGVILTPAGRVSPAPPLAGRSPRPPSGTGRESGGGGRGAEAGAVLDFVETGRRSFARRAAAVRRSARDRPGLAPGLARAAWRTPGAHCLRGALSPCEFLPAGRAEQFDWLARRRMTAAVFAIYDLLPLAFPAFFRPGEDELHRRRLLTAARMGRALLTPASRWRRNCANF